MIYLLETTAFNNYIIPIIGVAVFIIVFLIKKFFFKKKENATSNLEKETLSFLEEIIVKTILDANEVYVNTLKDKDGFTKEAQEEALTAIYNEVIKDIPDDC